MIRRNKFNSRRVVFDGQSFPSMLEGALWTHLKLLEYGGKLRDVTRQPTVFLTKAKISFKPDFMAYDVELGKDVYYESKGVETERWRMIKKLWEYYGPSILRVYRGTHRRLTLAVEIIPKE